MAKVLAVIPSRLASQRLPQKPLQDIGGKSLLQRVWERGRGAKTINRLIVATDSAEIQTLAESFGAEVMMTAETIKTGSERVAAVHRELAGRGGEAYDLIVNLQGDMPFIPSELIDRAINFFINMAAAGRTFSMTTIATPITEREMFESKSDVKVVIGSMDQALYFSRSPVPFSRDGEKLQFSQGDNARREIFGYKHFGLYVFKPECLNEFLSGPESALEKLEKLEQLRLLDRGLTIGVCVVEEELTRNSVEVDTPQDLERSRALASREKS